MSGWDVARSVFNRAEQYAEQSWSVVKKGATVIAKDVALSASRGLMGCNGAEETDLFEQPPPTPAPTRPEKMCTPAARDNFIANNATTPRRGVLVDAHRHVEANKTLSKDACVESAVAECNLSANMVEARGDTLTATDGSRLCDPREVTGERRQACIEAEADKVFVACLPDKLLSCDGKPVDHVAVPRTKKRVVSSISPGHTSVLTTTNRVGAQFVSDEQKTPAERSHTVQSSMFMMDGRNCGEEEDGATLMEDGSVRTAVRKLGFDYIDCGKTGTPSNWSQPAGDNWNVFSGTNSELRRRWEAKTRLSCDKDDVMTVTFTSSSRR